MQESPRVRRVVQNPTDKTSTNVSGHSNSRIAESLALSRKGFQSVICGPINTLLVCGEIVKGEREALVGNGGQALRAGFDCRSDVFVAMRRGDEHGLEL